MPMTATKVAVSAKTKVAVGVGLLTIAGLAAYGFVTLNSTSTIKTVTPAPAYKPTFIIMKAADAPSDAKVITGTGVIVSKMAVSSDDVITWGKSTISSVAVARSGTAAASAFKNWKLCNQNNTCVTGSVSGSSITFSNVGPLLVKHTNQSSFIRSANAATLGPRVLTIKVDIGSGYKGSLALSIPSTASVSGFKTTEWVPSSSYLQKAGLVGSSDIVYGETSPQVAFTSGAASLSVGSIIIQ